MFPPQKHFSHDEYKPNGVDDPLFRPKRVGTLDLPNRVVVAPMGNGRNIISDEGMAWYRRLACGKPGLLIVQASNVEWINSGISIRELSRLPEMIHSYGVPVIIQLVCRYFPWRCASDLSISEIRNWYTDFALATRNCYNAGFDGVELHGAHGYTLNQFLSRFKNFRSDQYGGSWENRMRCALELAESVRTSVSSNFILAYRHTPKTRFVRYFGNERDNEIDYGLEESLEFAKKLIDSGLDLLEISPGSERENSDLSAPFKELPVPIISVGGFTYPDKARFALEENRCDLVAIGRAFIADANWLIKVRLHREKEIIPCIHCNECFNDVITGEKVTCHREWVLASHKPYILGSSDTHRELQIDEKD